MRAILTYHSLDGSGSAISVAPEVFQEHVRWLSSGTVKVVPLGRLLDPTLEGPAVAITFDDGFANLAGQVTRLADESLPATVFVVTGHVGRDNAWGGSRDSGIPTLPLMDWHELGLLAERGLELGAHTKTHPRLPNLSRQQVVEELEEPLETMERQLGLRPTAFAYPYGSISPAVTALAGERYRWSCTTDLRMVGAVEDPKALPRLDMYYWRAPGAIARLGRSSTRAQIWIRRQARRARALLTR